MTKKEGSGSESGSIGQRHGSADPEPDPHQNVMDPQHCLPQPYHVLQGGIIPESGTQFRP
jgi:hypothetical protein